MLGERAKHTRPGDDIAPPKLGPHALEDRPQDLALLAADPRLATKTRHVAIGSQLLNCQASTTSLHSPNRKRSVKRWPSTCPAACRSNSRTSADGAILGCP